MLRSLVTMSRVACIVTALAVAASATLAAQWPAYPTPDVPRTASGEPRMDAPAPQTAGGTPDLSGTWENFRPPAEPATGTDRPLNTAFFDETPPSIIRLFPDVGSGVEGGLPFQPWAAERRRQRMAEDSKDNPDALCLPMGFMQFHTHPQPRQIVQTDDLVLIIYEANYGLRYVFTDGRALPLQGEPQPWWYGYSVGRWEDDTLVVETNNLVDDIWLDVNGSPLTDAARVTERFRRPTFGTLEIAVTVDDPKAYTRPWTVSLTQRLMVDSELIEFVCNENQQYGKRVEIE
jgi:hypothetical protein